MKIRRIEFSVHRKLENVEKLISDNEVVTVHKRVIYRWRINDDVISLGEMTFKELQQIAATFNGCAEIKVYDSLMPYFSINHINNIDKARSFIEYFKRYIEIYGNRIKILEKKIEEYESNNKE